MNINEVQNWSNVNLQGNVNVNLQGKIYNQNNGLHNNYVCTTFCEY